MKNIDNLFIQMFNNELIIKIILLLSLNTMKYLLQKNIFIPKAPLLTCPSKRKCHKSKNDKKLE